MMWMNNGYDKIDVKSHVDYCESRGAGEACGGILRSFWVMLAFH